MTIECKKNQFKINCLTKNYLNNESKFYPTDEMYNYILKTSDNILSFMNINYKLEINIISNIDFTSGLGTSGAIIAGLITNIRKLEGFNTDNESEKYNILNIAVNFLRQYYNKHSSGIDLATSIFCNENNRIIFYENLSNNKQKVTYLPNFLILNNLILDIINCGYKTKTDDAINLVKNNELKNSKLYKKIYNQMRDSVVNCKNAIIENKLNVIVTELKKYQILLEAIGVSDNKIKEIIQNQKANKNVLVSKISGSGLGDNVISIRLLS